MSATITNEQITADSIIEQLRTFAKIGPDFPVAAEQVMLRAADYIAQQVAREAPAELADAEAAVRAVAGQPFAWMKPNEITGLLGHAKRNTETRYYGRVYAEQYDPDMVRVYAQATPTPNATGETDREIALRFKREADALWHRVNAAEAALTDSVTRESAPAEKKPHEEPVGHVKDHFKGTDKAYRTVIWADRTFAMDVPDGAPLFAAPTESAAAPGESDRTAVLLKAAHALLKKQAFAGHVINLLSETVHYDGTDCDGLCLISDIEDELGLDGEARPA